MYKSFRVKNFRCFKDLQINDLGRVNLIAGRNNTGKTALMEAMYLHTKPLTPRVLFQLQQVRGLDVPDKDLPSYWKQFFHGMDSSKAIEIEAQPKPAFCTKLTITELESGKNPDAFAQFQVRRGRATSLSEVLKSIEAGDVFLEFVLTWDKASAPAKVYFAPDLPTDSNKEAERASHFIPVQTRPDKHTVAEQFSQIELGGALPKLITSLQIFEPRLSDLRLLSPYGETIIWGRIDGSQMPLRLMGDGINQMSHFLLTMMTNPKSMIFIDEIENGIHHSVQKDVWKAIGQVARELDIQVFATTHSYEMIEAAHEAFKDDEPYEFRFHRLYRDSATGNIEARTYNQFGVDAAITREREVRG